MAQKFVRTAEMKEDLKFVALLLGGSLIISLATILSGAMISDSSNSSIQEVGYAVEVLGYLWVAGTVGVGVFLQSRMRHLHRPAPIEVTADSSASQS